MTYILLTHLDFNGCRKWSASEPTTDFKRTVIGLALRRARGLSCIAAEVTEN